MDESLPTVPPPATGIQQQPSADELVAAATKSTKEHTSAAKMPKGFVIGGVLFLVGCVVGAVGVSVARMGNSSQQPVPSVMVEQPGPEDQLEATQAAQPLVMRSMLEDGSFVPVFDPFGFTLDSQWQDRGLAFDLSYLFYIPDVSTVSNVELDPVINPSRPLYVLQLEVTDTRPTGVAQPIQAHTYLAGRTEAMDYPAPAFHTVEISPGETKKLYVPLQMPEVLETFLLLSGDQGNPVVTEILLPPVASDEPSSDSTPPATESGEATL